MPGISTNQYKLIAQLSDTLNSNGGSLKADSTEPLNSQDLNLPLSSTKPLSSEHASELFWTGYLIGWGNDQLDRFAAHILEDARSSSDPILQAKGLYLKSIAQFRSGQLERGLASRAQAIAIAEQDRDSQEGLGAKAELIFLEGFVLAEWIDESEGGGLDGGLAKMLTAADDEAFVVNDGTKAASLILLSRIESFANRNYSAIEHALAGLTFAKASKNVDFINNAKYSCLFALSNCHFELGNSKQATQFANDLVATDRLTSLKKRIVQRMLRPLQQPPITSENVAQFKNGLLKSEWESKSFEERAEYLEAVLFTAKHELESDSTFNLMPLLVTTIKLAQEHCGSVINEIEVVTIEALFKNGDQALAKTHGDLLFNRLVEQSNFALASKLVDLIFENSESAPRSRRGQKWLAKLGEMHEHSTTEMVRSLFRAASHREQQMHQRRLLAVKAEKIASARDDLLREAQQNKYQMATANMWGRRFAMLSFFLCTVFLIVTKMRKSRQKVVDRLRDFETTARRAAEQTSEEKEMLLARVCHDLRTPLSVVRLCSSIVSTTHGFECLDDEDVKRQKKVIRLLNDSAMQMSYMTDQLLAYSKSERNVQQCPEVLDPCELLSKIRDSFALRLAESDVDIALEVASNAPDKLHIDGSLVQEVLNNLIDNAIKFTPSGNIVIHYRTGSGGNPQIAVEDKGCGMNSELLQSAFAPFFSGNAQSEHLANNGIGLGLFICDKLTRRLGGSITIASELNIGTTVTLNLPLSTLHRSVGIPTAQSANRVLLVAHSLNVEVAASKALSNLCWESKVTDNQNAVTAIKKSPPGVVVVDLAVEEEDSFAVVKAIVDSCGHDIPIVAISNSTRLLQQSRSFSCIREAIPRESFYAKIEYHLSKHIKSGAESTKTPQRKSTARIK